MRSLLCLLNVKVHVLVIYRLLHLPRKCPVLLLACTVQVRFYLPVHVEVVNQHVCNFLTLLTQLLSHSHKQIVQRLLVNCIPQSRLLQKHQRRTSVNVIYL